MLIERHIGIAFNVLAVATMAPSALANLHGHAQAYHPLVGVALALAVLGVLFSTAVAATHPSPVARWIGFAICGVLALAYSYGHLLCALQVSRPTLRAIALAASAAPLLPWATFAWKFRRDPA